MRGANGPAEDRTEPGSEVILEAGGAIFDDADVVHTARGADDMPTVILAALVLETGAQLLMPADMEMGTPVPSSLQ